MKPNEADRYRKFIESTEPVTETIYNGLPMPKFVTLERCACVEHCSDWQARHKAGRDRY